MLIAPNTDHISILHVASRYRISGAVILRRGARLVHDGLLRGYVRDRCGPGIAYTGIYGGCLWVIYVSDACRVRAVVLAHDGSLGLSVVSARDVPWIGDIEAGRMRRFARRA